MWRVSIKEKNRKRAIAMGLVLGIACSMLHGTAIDAKKSTVKKKVIYKCSKLIVADGTKYKISQVAKDTRGRCWTDQGSVDHQLSKLIKNKKVKWISRDRNLKMKGASFTAKKPGTYKLTGTAKKEKYQLTLEVVSKKPKTDLSQVTYMVIRSGSDGSSVKIQDPDLVRDFCTMICAADYTFDHKLAKKGRRVGWNYAVKFYAANGEEQYTILNSVPEYYYTSSKYAEIHAHTAKLFNQEKEAQHIAK
ncbi:MAG: hypothetical protein HFG32_06160 [Eubacterium sp.]|jgi:hypothetical protein|nr:hypothetical protein [Eubacterium sp.]